MYHTALSEPASAASPREYWAGSLCHAFVHDVTLGFPCEFDECQVLYSEIPWADGHEEFYDRAGQVLRPTYPELMYQLNCELAQFARPWVIVGGYAMTRHLGCQWFTPVTLNGSTAMAMGAYGPPPPIGTASAGALLQWLSGNSNYYNVADPFCGYGRTARIFAEAGKKFVATDINPDCIGYIAQEAPAWLSNIT